MGRCSLDLTVQPDRASAGSSPLLIPFVISLSPSISRGEVWKLTILSEHRGVDARWGGVVHSCCVGGGEDALKGTTSGITISVMGGERGGVY